MARYAVDGIGTTNVIGVANLNFGALFQFTVWCCDDEPPWDKSVLNSLSNDGQSPWDKNDLVRY